MASFSYRSSGSTVTTTTVLSLTANYPGGSGAPAVGDALFLAVSGNTTGTAFTWTPPSGWTEIGSVLRATDSAGNKNAVQVFWKVHDTGSSATVTTTTFGTFRWQAVVLAYSGTGTAKLVGTAADEVSGSVSTFQPAAFTAAADAVVVNLTAFAGSGGNLSYSTANGFTARSALGNSGTPTSVWGDKAVTAGSVTMPSFTAGASNPWLSKTFALDRQGTSGWSVGQIKF